MVVIPCTPDAIPRISLDHSTRATKTELTEPSDLSSILRPVAWRCRFVAGPRRAQPSDPSPTDPGQRYSESVGCAVEPNELLEVENGAAPGERRRIDFHADILLDPLGGTPGGLIGAGLVLTDGHGLPESAVGGGDRYSLGYPARRHLCPAGRPRRQWDHHCPQTTPSGIHPTHIPRLAASSRPWWNLAA
jgi:hypothetical protein